MDELLLADRHLQTVPALLLLLFRGRKLSAMCFWVHRLLRKEEQPDNDLHYLRLKHGLRLGHVQMQAALQ